MNLAELSGLIDQATDVLRVETLDRYSSNSDVDWPAAYLRGDPPPDVAAKQSWLDRLRRSAANGTPRRRLRIVQRPVTDYVRYACEWGYVDNAAAGEDIRVIDEGEARVPGSFVWVGDYYVLDGAVYPMRYDEDGRFVEAWEASRHERLVDLAERSFAAGEPFTQWWAAHRELHRDTVTA